MGWLIALGVLLTVLFLPLGAGIRYNSAGVQIRVLTGPLQWKVFPAKKKEPKPEKPKKTKEKTKKAPASGKKQKKTAEKPKEKGGPLTDFLPLVYVVLDLLADVPRLFRIHRLELNVILASSDPADLGENYGKACAALGNLWPRLEELFVIRRRNVQLQCDFESSETKIIARADISVTLGRVLGFVFRYGFRALGEYLKIMNKRKGGAAV